MTMIDKRISNRGGMKQMRQRFNFPILDPRPAMMYKEPNSLEGDIVPSPNIKHVMVEETEYTHQLEHKILRLRHKFKYDNYCKKARLIVSVKDFMHLILIHSKMVYGIYAQHKVEIPTVFMDMEITVVPQGELQVVHADWRDMMWDNIKTNSDGSLID